MINTVGKDIDNGGHAPAPTAVRQRLIADLEPPQPESAIEKAFLHRWIGSQIEIAAFAGGDLVDRPRNRQGWRPGMQ